MQLLRGVHNFRASQEEMTHLWILFCRSVVWHSSLPQENIDDLERTQKTYAKIMMKDKYKDDMI